jgi:competence ComEA-like helix-hairpin-helix protein
MRFPRPESLSPRRWAEILLTGLVLVLLVVRLGPGGGETDSPGAADLTHRIDLNRAPWHELVNLPGIGEKRAREIVSDREARGPFSGPDELDRVPGIGPKTVRRIREFSGGD